MRTPWFLLLLSACVPKGQFELIDVQLEATRAAMNASSASCRDDLQQRDLSEVACGEQIAARQSQLDALAGELDRVRAELTVLHTAEAARLLALEEASVPVKPDPSNPPVEQDPEAVGALAAALDQAAQGRIREARLAERHARVEALFAPLAEKGVSVRRIEEGSAVTLPVAKLYNEERMTISPLGDAILEQSAAALGELADHRLEVRGHTDAQPFHSSEYASNWELGFGWAVGVMRVLQERKIPMSATASSWAETRPVGGDAPDARKANRRVELVLTVDPELLSRFPPTPPAE